MIGGRGMPPFGQGVDTPMKIVTFITILIIAITYLTTRTHCTIHINNCYGNELSWHLKKVLPQCIIFTRDVICHLFL